MDMQSYEYFCVFYISKLPIAKTLRNLRNEKPICIFLQILAKLKIAKLYEPRICETLRILRNNCKTAKKVFAKPSGLLKLVFAKLAKHDLQNLVKHCETLIAKIAKIGKIEWHCKTMIQNH